MSKIQSVHPSFLKEFGPEFDEKELINHYIESAKKYTDSEDETVKDEAWARKQIQSCWEQGLIKVDGKEFNQNKQNVNKQDENAS